MKLLLKFGWKKPQHQQSCAESCSWIFTAVAPVSTLVISCIVVVEVLGMWGRLGQKGQEFLCSDRVVESILYFSQVLLSTDHNSQCWVFES
jgi:hypothetical protein